MRVSFLVAVALAGLSFSCAASDDGSIKAEPHETPKAPLPPEFAKLGEPCPPPEQMTPGGSQLGCGKEGRVSMVTVYGRTSLPEGAQKLEGSHGGVIVVVEDERVWVQATCFYCRTFTESTSVTLFAYATDDQLMQMQMQAELVNKSPLRDANAWRAAIAAWEPKG